MVNINVYDENGNLAYVIPSHDSFYMVRVSKEVADGMSCKVYDESGDCVYTMEAA